MRKAPETLTSSTSALFVLPGEKQTLRRPAGAKHIKGLA